MSLPDFRRVRTIPADTPAATFARIPPSRWPDSFDSTTEDHLNDQAPAFLAGAWLNPTGPHTFEFNDPTLGTLFLGNRLNAEHLFKSIPFALTTVASLCEEEIIRRNPTINNLHFPISDSDRIEVEQFDAIIDAIGENIRCGKVLVHCGRGWSRAPIPVAAWMDVVGYKNIDRALEEIATLRPAIAPSQQLLCCCRVSGFIFDERPVSWRNA